VWYRKIKLSKRNTFLILIQIQNRIIITTTQIGRKNLLIRNENEIIDTYKQYEIQEI